MSIKLKLTAAQRQQAAESMLADLQSGESVVFDDSRSGPTVVRFCGKELGSINEEEYQRKARPFQAAPTGLFRSLAHALEAVRWECQRQKFWPNCYHVNDHGNVSLWDSAGREITSWV
jgi:hypothetical protein